MNEISNRVKARYSAVTVGFMVGMLGLMGAANAAVDPVADGFDTIESKITTYGVGIVAIVIASVLLFLGIKYLRRGASKA